LAEQIKLLKYGIVFDRRGRDDIICSAGAKYASEKFRAAVSSIANKYPETEHFKASDAGCGSDANHLCRLISCVNLSVGYYEPHTAKEFVNLREIHNTLFFGSKILDDLTEAYAPPTNYTCKTSYAGHASTGWNRME
jgi:hypothetical protein